MFKIIQDNSLKDIREIEYQYFLAHLDRAMKMRAQDLEHESWNSFAMQLHKVVSCLEEQCPE